MYDKYFYIINNVGNKIRCLRKTKELSQDYLALQLGITQPSYARLEKDDHRLNIVRLIQIARILKTTVADLVDEKNQNVINQQNSQRPNAYVDSVINADKEHIETLRSEIAFLRKLTENKIID
ncbi:helix-turn-helix domain-containing protein [Mesonia sp. HuA40]|uniref:helix-turn-helix domain-containing protein n=1 Tax=Mesonia sp. HuA40 TaxID=2602761 RepID=UPI0011C75D99|nr:helix-turn-helix transcriptional regulator [Mesonia sp. HuA40]